MVSTPHPKGAGCIFKPMNHPVNPDEMLDEYDFDYSQAKPNRFAKRIQVSLDADVARVFTTSEEVNQALRAILQALPKTQRQKPPN